MPSVTASRPMTSTVDSSSHVRPCVWRIADSGEISNSPHTGCAGAQLRAARAENGGFPEAGGSGRRRDHPRERNRDRDETMLEPDFDPVPTAVQIGRCGYPAQCRAPRCLPLKATVVRPRSPILSLGCSADATGSYAISRNSSALRTESCQKRNRYRCIR